MIMSQRKQKALIVAGLMFIGAISRAPTVSLGPLFPEIKESLQINYGIIGLIMTIPVIALGVSSIPVSTLINRKGLSFSIILGLAIYGLSLPIRSFMGFFGLFTGTFLVGLGMAFTNILSSVIIKEHFPLKIGIMTGLYTTVMYLFSALSSAVAVPLSDAFNSWQVSLSLWFPLIVFTLLLWVYQIKRGSNINYEVTTATFKEAMGLIRIPLVRWITVLMASQSIIYFCTLSYMPAIMQEAGFSGETAGLMASVVQLSGIPSALLSGAVVYKFKKQQLPCVFVAFTFLIATLLMIYSRSLFGFFLCSLFMGFSMAASYTLYLCILTLRSKNSSQAGMVAGATSLFGYLITSLGPTIMGFAYNLFSSFTLPLYGLVICAFFYGLSGIKSGKDMVMD